jgi:hypothetical protein
LFTRRAGRDRRAVRLLADAHRHPAFGLIDLSRISVQKRQLQDALDAATLMAARSTATTDAISTPPATRP